MYASTPRRLSALVVLLIIAATSPIAEAEKPDGAGGQNPCGWRLGTQAYTFNHYTFFEAIDKTASLGLRYIEAYPGQKLSQDQPNVVFDHNASDKVIEAVQAKLKQAKLKLVNYGVVSLGSDEAADRKVFDFAKKLGIETIVAEPKPGSFDLLDRLTDEYGINIAIHNHPRPSRYWNPQTVLKAIKGHSARIGACADTGHWMRSGIHPLDAVRQLEGHIISFHFKDLNEFGVRTAHDVPWGTGKADIRAILAELKRQGFHGVFSIEYEYHWTSSLPEISQCVAYFRHVVRDLCPCKKP